MRTPNDARALFEGYAGVWWIAGGWALEAFTGLTRAHEDLDPSVLIDDRPLLRRYLAGRLHVWAAFSGAVMPLASDDRPGELTERLLPEGCHQIWTRVNAEHPWEYDILLAPGTRREWVYGRDPNFRMPMAEALWERDRVRYLQPEIQNTTGRERSAESRLTGAPESFTAVRSSWSMSVRPGTQETLRLRGGAMGDQPRENQMPGNQTPGEHSPVEQAPVEQPTENQAVANGPQLGPAELQPDEPQPDEPQLGVMPPATGMTPPTATPPAATPPSADHARPVAPPAAPPVVPPPAAPLAAPAAPPTPPAVSSATAPAASAAPMGVAAPASSPGTSWLTAFSSRVLLGGLAHVGIAIAAAFISAVVLLMLLMASGGTSASATPLPSLNDLQIGATALIGMLFTLTGFIYGGEISMSMGGNAGMFSGAGAASLWMFPLTLTVASLITVLWWGIRQARIRPLPTHLHRAAYGVGVGLATGLLLLILTVIFAVRTGEGGVHLEITAAGFRVVLFSVLLVGGAAFLGRWAGMHAQDGDIWIAAAARAFHGAPRLVREPLVYAALGAVLFGLIGAVYLAVAAWDGMGPAAIGLAVVGLLNVAPFAAALGHLGGIGVSGGFGGAVSKQTMAVFNAGEPWLWLLVLAALLLSIFAAVWIGTRRPRRSGGIEWRTAWQLPVVVFSGWIIFGVLFFGLGFGAAGGAGIFGGTIGGGIGVALWSAFVFLIWAIAVEIGAQTLPRLVYGVAPQLHSALAGRAAAAAWVAGPAGTSPAQPAEGTPAEPGEAMFGQTPDAGPAAELRPLSPAAKRGLLIGLASVGGVIVLVIAASIAISVANSSRSPEAVVQQYLEHIAGGRADAANALVDPDVPNAQRQFLTDDVMAAATERITDVKAKSMRVGESEMAYVTVTYRLDGVQQEDQLSVAKGQPELLVLDTWVIQDSLVRVVNVPVRGQGAAAIGGVELPVTYDGSYGYAEIALYPGIYDVTSSGSEYFELADGRLAVGGRIGMTGTELTFVPTDSLRDEVQQQVDALLQKCVADTAADPNGCPFSAFTYNDDTQVTWTLQGQPTLEIDETGSRVSVKGVAVGSYSEEFFGTTREREDESRFSMYGDITVEGDTVSVEFEDTWW